MTAPRQILPENYFLITRRCTQRQFLLRPDGTTNQIFRYCLAEAAARFGIVVIAWMAMSNHHHTVVFDPTGILPAFMAHLHKMLAKVMNARWGRWENFWSVEQASAVRLVGPEDVFDKVVYALTNPVADHLVDSVSEWPGANSLDQMDGRPIVIERPTAFFSEDGVMPERVTLVAAVPPFWTAGQDAWRARVLAAVARREGDFRLERMEKSLQAVGWRAILETSHLDQPTTPAPRRQLRPVIACAEREVRIQVLAALREFRLAYAAARAAMVAGARAIFPAGTYLLRLQGVPCEAVQPAPG